MSTYYDALKIQRLIKKYLFSVGSFQVLGNGVGDEQKRIGDSCLQGVYELVGKK